MTDGFDEKRSMVKKLLDMLKEHASNEVGNDLQHPEGEGDMHGLQVERVEVLPDHEMDHSTPEHDVVTHELSHGGVVEDVNAEKYSREGKTEIPYEPKSGEGQPEIEGSAHEEATESPEERQSEGDTTPSMFEAFLKRKKK